MTDATIIVIYFAGMVVIVSVYNYIKYLVQKKTSQRLFKIVVVYENGMTRTVSVKASSRQVAENRALKRCPGAISVNRSQ